MNLFKKKKKNGNHFGNYFQRNVRSSISYLWVSAQESIEFWTQFLRSEATDTVMDVWHDAKPGMQEFMDDVKYSTFFLKPHHVNYYHKFNLLF